MSQLSVVNPLLETDPTKRQETYGSFSKPLVSKNAELGYNDTWLAKKIMSDFTTNPSDNEMLGRFIFDIQNDIKFESKLIQSSELEKYQFQTRGYVDDNAYVYKPETGMTSDMKEFLARFSSTDQEDFQALQARGQDLGMPSPYGILILDPEGNYRIGIYDYLTGTVLANPDGSQLEFLATNQAQQWAATQKYLSGRNLLTTSPAWKTKTKDVDRYTVDSATNLYVGTDGKPITLATVDTNSGAIVPNFDYDPDLFPNPVDTAITPETILYYSNINPKTGQDGVRIPVRAKDVVPQDTLVESRGLEFYLRDTPYEQSLRNYNLAATNNWMRFTRVGDYGLADQSIGLFGVGGNYIDPTVVPLVDAAAHWVSGFEFGGAGINDPRVVASKYTPEVPGEEVYKLILSDTPLASSLMLMGVDLEKVRQAKTSGEVWGILNGTLMANAVSKSIQTRTKNDGWFTWAGRGIGTMAYHTLTGGDAVAQTVVMVATGGTGVVVAGGATTISRLSSSASRLSTIERLAQVSRVGTTTAKETKLLFGLTFTHAWGGVEGFGKALRGVNAALPVNFANNTVKGLTTVAKKFLPIRSTRGAITAAQTIESTSRIRRVGSWLLNQSVEGFIEEGIQEFAGQTVDMINGLRTTYDKRQIWSNAVDGLWAEPLLGGVLYGPFKGQGWLFNKMIYGGLSTQSKILGLNPARVIQMEDYLAQFYGSYDNLDQTTRIARAKQVLRMVIIEDSIKKTTVGNMVNPNQAPATIAKLIVDVDKALPGAKKFLPEAYAHIEELVDELNADYLSSSTSPARKEAINKAINEGVLVKVNNKLYLSSDSSADLAALLSIEHTSPEKAETARVQYLQNKYASKIKDQTEVEQIVTDLTKGMEYLLNALSLKATNTEGSKFAAESTTTVVADAVEALNRTPSGAVSVPDPTTPETAPAAPATTPSAPTPPSSTEAPVIPPATESTAPTPTPAPSTPVVPSATPKKPTAPTIGIFTLPRKVTVEIETLLADISTRIESSSRSAEDKAKVKAIIQQNVNNTKHNRTLVNFLMGVKVDPFDSLNRC